MTKPKPKEMQEALTRIAVAIERFGAGEGDLNTFQLLDVCLQDAKQALNPTKTKLKPTKRSK